MGSTATIHYPTTRLTGEGAQMCGKFGEAGMTRDEIIELAREQGLPETETEGVFRVNTDDIGRLLAAAELRRLHVGDV